MSNQTQSPVTASSVVNGLDTAVLGGLAELLEAHPEGGRVTFSSQSDWQGGARVESRVRGYWIDGELHHQDERSFVLKSDEPVELSGSDTQAGPVEQLMHALASCIAATVNAKAALQGVKLSKLQVRIESDLDLHGYFGLDQNVRPGLSELRAELSLAGEADAATLRSLAEAGYRCSPVRDSLAGGVRLKPSITTER